MLSNLEQKTNKALISLIAAAIIDFKGEPIDSYGLDEWLKDNPHLTGPVITAAGEELAEIRRREAAAR